MLEHRVSGKMRVFTGGKKYDSLSHNMVSLTGKICVLYCWGGESTRGGTNRGPRAWLACLRDRGDMIRLLQLLTIMIGPIARGVHHARLSLSLGSRVRCSSACARRTLWETIYIICKQDTCAWLSRDACTPERWVWPACSAPGLTGGLELAIECMV